jgi:O-antigen/teichoic acid export membrane protein
MGARSAPREFLSSAISSGLVLTIGMLTGILAARTLGVDDRGNLGIVVFWGQFFASLTVIAIADGMLVTGVKRATLDTAVSSALRITLLASLFALPLGAAVIFALLHQRQHDPAIISWAIAFWSLQLIASYFDQISQGCLRIQGRFRTINTLRVLMPIIYLLLASSAALFGFGLIGFVLAQMIAVALNLTISAAVAIPREALFTPPAHLRQLASTGLRFHQLTILALVTTQIDKLLIVQFSPSTEVGLYLVALTLSAPVQSILGIAIRTLALPRLRSLAGAEQQRATKQILKHAWVASALGAAATAAVAPLALPFLFGASFVDAGMIAAALTLAQALVPIRTALTEIAKVHDDSNAPRAAEFVYLGGFAIATLLATLANFPWPVIWGVMIGNVLSTLFLSKRLQSKYDTPAISEWASIGPLAILQLVGLLFAAVRFRR